MLENQTTHRPKTIQSSSAVSPKSRAQVFARLSGCSIVKVCSLALLMCVTLSSCSKYQMTVNETVVYTPPAIITDFNTEDPRLKGCLDQIIKDGQFTELGQVTQLICSHAGLTSLEGIQTFYNLEQVNLGHNQITDLSPIKFLSKLEILLLNDNQISQAPELLNLPKLQQVRLDNNPQLQCGDLHQLQRVAEIDLTLPSQCQ
ncbi:MAG: leucine-rich repeat domain-containing protein [Cellvibrionaceae bacterium]